MNKLNVLLNLKTSFMKRVVIFIICLNLLLITSIYGQKNPLQAGLSLDTYQLPSNRTGFTNYSSSNYYQPVLGEQKRVPTLVLNQQKLKRDKIVSLFVNTLLILNTSLC